MDNRNDHGDFWSTQFDRQTRWSFSVEIVSSLSSNSSQELVLVMEDLFLCKSRAGQCASLARVDQSVFNRRTFWACFGSIVHCYFRASYVIEFFTSFYKFELTTSLRTRLGLGLMGPDSVAIDLDSNFLQSVLTANLLRLFRWLAFYIAFAS